MVGYGPNGKLGSTLTTSSGALESSRDGSFTLNAVNADAKLESLLFLERYGFPTGGINSYDHAISFEFPDPSEITLSSDAVPPSGSGTSIGQEFQPVRLLWWMLQLSREAQTFPRKCTFVGKLWG